MYAPTKPLSFYHEMHLLALLELSRDMPHTGSTEGTPFGRRGFSPSGGQPTSIHDGFVQAPGASVR